jgi:hypothetical protein
VIVVAAGGGGGGGFCGLLEPAGLFMDPHNGAQYPNNFTIHIVHGQ